MTALATVTGNLYIVLGTLVFSLLTLLLGWLPPRGAWTSALARMWSGGFLASGGVRLRAVYDPGLDPAGRYVFLPNHQSYFDIPALLVSSPGPIRLLAKRSLFRIPVFGWALALGGFIPVDRGNRATARDSFAAAVARLSGGTSIVLFPEGTRSRSGRLLPFERGGFLLALKSGLPIVPVGIRGTRAVQPPRSFAIRPGVVEVRYGAPLDPAAYGVRRKGELVAEVRRRIAELSGLELEEGEALPGTM